MNKIEEEIKENWPSAVEGDLEHPELGLIHYWTGEQRGRIVLRFSFERQAEGESAKMFFINLKQDSWVLSHISTFKSSDSKLKLVKNQSFKEQDELEDKYRSIIELFLESRKKRNPF
tara:strand:+ start:152 stop:502 length:351 start_codon:yes stop_codon:yes gene_type:complete